MMTTRNEWGVKEALEQLLYRIVTKKEPKLEGKFKVSWGGRAHYEICQNGRGALLKIGLAPSDKRLSRVLDRAPSELLALIEGRPFSQPKFYMTQNERWGWDELVALGARPFSDRPHALDIRRIPLRQQGKKRMDLARLTHALTLVVGDGVDGANVWLRDGTDLPIGVYTKERREV